MATHAVTNQAVPLVDVDLYAADPVLADAVRREGGGWGDDTLHEFGRRCGSAEVVGWGFDANIHEPELRTHDRFGHRIDEVEFHPAWHRLMELSISNGLHSLPFERPPATGARVVRDGLFTIVNRVESGHTCPVSMTTSVLPALRVEPGLAEAWSPTIVSRTYDPGLRPLADKRGVLLGMGMTEKQGGSDVRANSSRAVASLDDDEGAYRLTGHKWFTSAPMNDAFLVLAQADAGLTCFLLPRVLPDGSLNSIRIERLKDKLGNRSNASAELEFSDALVHRVGPVGRGVPTIIEMVNHTRLDCVAGSSGTMRQAVTQAAWHCAHRHAFGSRLIDKALMSNVLADLELEVEAITLMMVRLSGAFDRAPVDPAEQAFRRLATPIAKYWATKQCTGVVREALECLGGNGYIEESIMPRLFRESPVNAIWEGSGNVIALDVVRVLARDRDAIDAFLAEVEMGRGEHRVLDERIDSLRSDLHDLDGVGDPEAGARRIVESMASVWAASSMVRYVDSHVADAFVASRVAECHSMQYGTLPAGLALGAIARRALPD